MAQGRHFAKKYTHVVRTTHAPKVYKKAPYVAKVLEGGGAAATVFREVRARGLQQPRIAAAHAAAATATAARRLLRGEARGVARLRAAPRAHGRCGRGRGPARVAAGAAAGQLLRASQVLRV